MQALFAFDYQIELNGAEIGDLAAFAYDVESQKSLTEDALSAETRQRIADVAEEIKGGPQEP